MSIESRSRQYGKVFDHWQIKEFLGSGSGGKTAVFRLVRSDSEWGVSALKVINLIEERGNIEELSDYRKREYEYAREECSRNAEQEVRLMDDLRGNTNIVDYLDHTFVDWSDDSGFGRDLLIRMELLKDLRSEIRSGKIFSEREVLKIGRDICIALIRCHRKNILHRDVKPENIFRNKDGDYKLGDFGVSRVLDACPGAVASTGIGTYEYWPAEQMTGRYDKRVDIYSLGLVLYELCNQNHLPFASSTYATGREVSRRLSGEPVPSPSGASAFLTPVILKACAFDPNERYQTAEELLKALNSVIHKLRSQENVDRTPRPQKSNPKKDTYETIPAESERVSKQNTTNPYRTTAARSGYRKQGSFETRPARSKAMYETEPVSKVHTERSASQASTNKNKFVLLAGMCVFVILLLVLGFLFVKGNKGEAISLKSEQGAQETAENVDATENTTTEETFETIAETEVPIEALAYTEVETEPIEMCTVYLQTSTTNMWNDIVYEYNEDGTLYRFANRSLPEYTTNYYIYDNGTLAEQIDSLNSDNPNQADKSQVIENIRSLLNYPKEERIQYRIVVLEQGFPVREIFTDINLNITRDMVHSYDSNGKCTSTIINGYDPVVSESHTYIQYDSAGYQTYKESYYEQKDAEWNNYKNTYSYIRDADGKIIEEIKSDSTQGQTVVKYTYNSEQQLIRKDEYNEWGSATGVYYEYTYDEYGNVTQRKYKVSENSEEAVDYNVYMTLQIAEDQLDALKLLYEYSMPSIPLNIQ